MAQLVRFGEWAPDAATVANNSLLTCKNVVAISQDQTTGVAYGPLNDTTSVSQSIGSRPVGFAAARDAASIVHNYAGTLTDLYELASDGSWTNRSKSVGAYTAGENDRWRGSLFNDHMVMTNGVDPAQYIVMSSGTAFADLPGSPPLAKYAKSFASFLVLGNVSTGTSRVVWSAIQDDTGWTDGVNQSGQQLLIDGGVVNGLGATDVMYVFQEFAIRRMSYVGLPAVMSFSLIEGARGCIIPGSLVQLGMVFFYIAQDGFYMFDGQSSTPIGSTQSGLSRVDKFFFADSAVGSWPRMTAAVDPLRKTIVWCYASNGASNGAPDTLLIYNWRLDKWSYAKPTSVEMLAANDLSEGLTIEQLDAIYGNLDAIPISLDDASFSGGAISIGALSVTGGLRSFSGSNLEATFETADVIGGPAVVSQAIYCRPLIDASNAVYAATGAKFQLGDAIVYAAESVQNASGLCPQRTTGRYLREKIRVPAATTWTKAEGFEIKTQIVGVR